MEVEFRWNQNIWGMELPTELILLQYLVMVQSSWWKKWDKNGWLPPRPALFPRNPIVWFVSQLAATGATEKGCQVRLFQALGASSVVQVTTFTTYPIDHRFLGWHIGFPSSAVNICIAVQHPQGFAEPARREAAPRAGWSHAHVQFVGHFSPPGIAIQIFEDAQGQVNRLEKKQSSFSELASGKKSAGNHGCLWIFQRESRAKICKCMHGNPQNIEKSRITMSVWLYVSIFFLGVAVFFRPPFTIHQILPWYIWYSNHLPMISPRKILETNGFSHLKLLSGNCPKLSFGGLRGISGTKGLRLGRDNLPWSLARRGKKWWNPWGNWDGYGKSTILGGKSWFFVGKKCESLATGLLLTHWTSPNL